MANCIFQAGKTTLIRVNGKLQIVNKPKDSVIQPSFDHLVIDPCLPTDWKEVVVRRRFRGVDYEIEILKPNGSCKGVKTMYLNGHKLEGNKIPIVEDRSLQKVKVIM